jgi:transcriptional regulator with XRE-family HTH domain
MGQRLADARQACGVEADEAASRLGISTRAYLRWERGECRKGWTRMCLRLVYVAELPISADWLLSGDLRPDGAMLFAPDTMSEILAKRDQMRAEQPAV